MSQESDPNNPKSESDDHSEENIVIISDSSTSGTSLKSECDDSEPITTLPKQTNKFSSSLRPGVLCKRGILKKQRRTKKPFELRMKRVNYSDDSDEDMKSYQRPPRPSKKRKSEQSVLIDEEGMRALDISLKCISTLYNDQLKTDISNCEVAYIDPRIIAGELRKYRDIYSNLGTPSTSILPTADLDLPDLSKIQGTNILNLSNSQDSTSASELPDETINRIIELNDDDSPKSMIDENILDNVVGAPKISPCTSELPEEIFQSQSGESQQEISSNEDVQDENIENQKKNEDLSAEKNE